MPIAAGFGISSAAQAREIGAIADGIVIGSAVVKMINENRDDKDMIRIVSDYTKAIKAALRS